MGYWNEGVQLQPGLEAWRESLVQACRWVTEVSQIRTEAHPFENSSFQALERYGNWRGAFRGEYTAATSKWDVFCPIWHGGQGVKALAMAYETLGDPAYLDAARLGADFILRHQISDEKDPDYGLILAYEDTTGINTSAVLESLDGLFTFARVTEEPRYAEAAVLALRWVRKRMFLPDEGLFADDYHPDTRQITRARFMRADVFPQPGRPLLDDGVFLTGWRLTGDEALKDVAIRTADRLLLDENPDGNWLCYPPAKPWNGDIHPRHAFWWGRPCWMVHQATGAQCYLDLCRRSARWYVGAMRSDGGLFRNTGPQFKTDSFGHATSGIACAVMLWSDLAREYGDTEWNESIRKGLSFCRSVQFTKANDSNLQGAVLEKVLFPAGSDALPWYLRELGTFFYVQALCQVIRDQPELLQ